MAWEPPGDAIVWEPPEDAVAVDTLPPGPQKISAQASVQRSPEWWAARRQEAALADADPLSAMPAIVSEPYRAIASAGASIGGTLVRPFSKDAADYIAGAKQQIATDTQALRNDDWSPWLSRMYGGIAESTALSVAGAPLGPSGIIGTFAATEANQALYDAEQVGLEGTDRLKYAVVQGAIEGTIASVFNKFAPGSEKFISQMVNGVMKTSGKQFLKMTAQEVPEELITELGHALAEKTSGVDPRAMASENFWPRMGETIVQTIGQVGLAHGVAKIAQGRQQIEELEAIRSKGFVTEQEAKELEFPSDASRNRRGRKKTIDDRIEQLQQETALLEQVVQEIPQSIQEPSNEVRQDQALPAGEEQVPAQPEVEAAPPAEVLTEAVPSALDDAKSEDSEFLKLMKRKGLVPEATPVPLSPREKAIQGKQPLLRSPTEPDEVEPAAQVEAIRQENKRKRFGRKDQQEAAPQARGQATYFKEPSSGDGRGMVGVQFDETPPQHVVDSLRNVLDSQGMEVGYRGRVLKFYTPNPNVSDDKITLAKQALHRVGFQRHDEAFDDQRSADDAFGVDAPVSPPPVPTEAVPAPTQEAAPESGRRVWREMAASELDSMINPNTSSGETFGGTERFWSDNPDLAIGQGSNKGFKVELDPEGLKLREHAKPGTEIAGVGKEFVTRHKAHEFRQGIRSIEIKPGAISGSSDATRVKRLLESEVQAGRWVKRSTESGGTIYSPASKAPTQPQPPSAAESGPEVVQTLPKPPGAVQEPKQGRRKPKQPKKTGLKEQQSTIPEPEITTYDDKTDIISESVTLGKTGKPSEDTGKPAKQGRKPKKPSDPQTKKAAGRKKPEAKSDLAPTDMMKRYQALKQEAPDSLLLVRMGDFYELFGDDAKTAAKTLGLTITERGKGTENPVPMAGFPYHSLEGYIAKLVKEGHKVAVAETADRKSGVGQQVTRVAAPESSKTKLQQAAADSLADAQSEADAFGKKIRGKGLPSNPMLDPELVAGAARVVYKYAKAGVYRFAAFTEHLAKSWGKQAVDAMNPVLRSEWNKLHATGEFPGMTDAEGKAKEPPAKAPDPAADLTSIKNEVVNELREARGVEPLADAPSQTREEWMEAAAARIAATNGTAGPSLVSEINRSPRNLSNIEVAVLQLHYRAVNNAFETAAQELFAATEGVDSTASAVAQTTADNLLAELVKIEEATKAAGREWGRAGVARQIALNRDFSLAAMATRARVANAGNPLNAEQTAEIGRMAKTIETLQRRLQAVEQKQVEMERQKNAARPTRKEALQKKASDSVKSFKEKWAALYTTGIVSDPKADAEKWAQITTAAVDVVKAYVDLGVFAFADFMDRVRADIGNDFADQAEEALKKAWDDLDPSSPRYTASLKKRIGDYRQRPGDFEQPKKEPRKLSREELDLKRELDDAKQEFFKRVGKYRLDNLTGLDRAIDYVRETAHLSRALMTSFDLSAVFRQGGAAVFAHPRLGLKSGKQMLQAAFSRQAEFDSAEEIRNRPNGQLYETARLSLTDNEEKITRQEEAFMGRWAKKIGPVRVSARAYTAFLNNLRADLFDSMVENLGRSGAVTLDEAKVIARFVNVATGRSDLGKFNGMAANLNTVFFAPRYVASRFQYLATPFLLPGMKTSGRVKKAIAIEYARHATGVAVFMGLAVGLGALLTDDDDEEPTVELDPRSSDFGKIKIGETRIDPLSGLSQTVVFLSRLASGQRKTAGGDIRPIRGPDVKFGDQTTADVIGHFLWSKLAPVPGAVVNMLQGKNVVGEEVSPAGAATDLFIPLSFQEVKDTMIARGIPAGTAISALAILGMGAATYGDRTKYLTGTETERQEQFGKFLKGMDWNTPDPAYADLLAEDQRTQVAGRRAEKRQAVIQNATAEPVRETHKSDETFAESVAERDKNRGFLQEMKAEGVTLAEAEQILKDHYYLPDKRGKRTMTSDEKPGYNAKLKKLRELYGE